MKYFKIILKISECELERIIFQFKTFVAVTIVVFAAPTAPNALADFYSWDFLTGEFDNVSLTPFGDGAVNLARPTKKGLRLRLPVGEKTAGIGFATRFQVRGYAPTW